MLLLHHPYAVDYFSILDRTKQTNHYDDSLRNSLYICALLFVCFTWSSETCSKYRWVPLTTCMRV